LFYIRHCEYINIPKQSKTVDMKYWKNHHFRPEYSIGGSVNFVVNLYIIALRLLREERKARNDEMRFVAAFS
jgi:hypothetical protein